MENRSTTHDRVCRQPGGFPNMLNRRHWLTRSLTAVGTLALLPTPRVLGSENEIVLRPNLNRELFRVRMEMDLQGNVNLPTNPLVSRKTQTKLPVKSEAVFDYEERLLYRSQQASSDDTAVSERYYHEAHSTNAIDRNHQKESLRDSVRHAIVRRERAPETIYAVNDYFTQPEMELLRVPASSMAVDRILPAVAVATGQKYEVPQPGLVALLNLASIEESDVYGEITEITDATAKIQLRGKVSGSAEGVPTVVRIVGKLTFDRKLQTCTWLAMAVHETREIGKAEPGFDIAATIKMVRQPLPRTIKLPAQPTAVAINQPIPADRLYMQLTGKEIGFTTLMDRRWRLMSDVPGSAMMRMIDNDRSIAQCDLRPLATLKPGTQWTMEAFQADVQRTLHQQLKQMLQADERVSDSGLRVLQVVATGAVEGVAIQWVIQHFSDDSGRRMLATFTMAGESADTFAGSDIQLANSLRFITPERIDAPSSNSLSSDQPNRPRIADHPSIAESNARQSDDVQSASDLGARRRR